jgi:hypothetical protein
LIDLVVPPQALVLLCIADFMLLLLLSCCYHVAV